VKVYFERRKIAEVFMTHVHDSTISFESQSDFRQKMSSVSRRLGIVGF